MVSHAGIGSGPGTANRARAPVTNAVTITEITLAIPRRVAARLGPDGWAVFTRDGSLAAHCEHTVAVTENGPRVLTRRDAPEQGSNGR